MFMRFRSLTMVFAALAVAATSACASRSVVYGYPSNSRAVQTQAYRNGYDQGRSRGENDARRGRPFDYQRYGEYREADWGYRGGNRGAYRDTFREGFVDGYTDGFRRYARDGYRYPQFPNVYRGPGGPAVYASPAAATGYRDGYDQGREDARERRAFDPVRARRYREGDHDYDRRYGSRDEYKRDYRAAFQQGYEQGYREGERR